LIKAGSTVTRRRFLGGAALLAAPVSLHSQLTDNLFEQQQEALRVWYEKKALRLAGVTAGNAETLRELLAECPVLYPPWTGRLDEYDHNAYGPLLAVSDEGENARVIAHAAYSSAKARAMHPARVSALGVMIDGERMVSAGEGPIGPEEFTKLIAAAFGRTFCSTNVGVRVNTRFYRLFPEFSVADAARDEEKWLAGVFAAFRPFVKTPDGNPRPLTVRLHVHPEDSAESVSKLVAKIETGRRQGLLGPASIHKISLLSIFDDVIGRGVESAEIKRILEIASRSGVAEAAIDGELLLGARQRVSVQSLLNILDVDTLRNLFAVARQQKLRLVYRYQIDTDSAVRTIWTGLHTTRSYGFTAGKYGLAPLTLDEQVRVVELISQWTKGWTAIPAFYVDTPLVTHDDIFDESRCVEGALLWMERVRNAGAKLALFDCPDRIAGRHLLRDEQDAEARGILSLEQIAALEQRGKELGLKLMWSGGITARQAFSLGDLGVFAIFSTGATSRRVAVHGDFADDPELASEGQPTEIGVRRVHAAIQAGFLASALHVRNPELAEQLRRRSKHMLQAIDAQGEVEGALSELDEALMRGWSLHWVKNKSN